ncbi:MAG TPA: MBL fold metallo-hydrolase [Candidatus Paceibacterota bacterium]
MVITYHGGQFFKIVFGDTTLAVNPISKASKLPQTRFGADIVLISLLDSDFDGIENVTHGDKQPFVAHGPGEYEVKKIFIRGIPATSSYGGSARQAAIYLVEMEGMHLAFLGPISSRKLPAESKELLEDIDILFVPIGGGELLSPSDAHELSVELEPRLVIPCHYDAAHLKSFLKEEGEENMKPVEKLTLKKKDLEGKEGEVIVLASE